MRNATFALLLLILPAVQAVVITQVSYDPAQETGGEFVQLTNDADAPVNISLWTLASRQFERDATIPIDTILAAGESYLIADIGWEGVWQAGWPIPDHAEALSLANDDAGVAIKDASGTIRDAVGWGNASMIPSQLFRGVPANDVSEGYALSRVASSGSNAADFVEAMPFDASAGTSIAAQLGIGDSPLPRIDSVSIDGQQAGRTVKLVPADAPRPFIVATEGKNLDEIEVRFREQVVNGTEAELTLPNGLAPGIYGIRVIGRNAYGETLRDFNLTVLPHVSIKTETEEVVMETFPGGEADVKSAPVVKNVGNVPVELGVVLHGFARLKPEIRVNGVRVAGKVTLLGVRLAPEEQLTLPMRIAVPVNAPQGSHQGTITITAKELK